MLRLFLEPIDSLPRFSWCAELRPALETVTVYHGPWVETRPDRFFAGAWAGDFTMGDFDRAESCVGSGGTLRENACVFSAPTNMFLHLASIRLEDRLLVSNSLVFLFSRARDKPSQDYPFYQQDGLRLRRWGVRRHPVRLPTQRGRTIHLHVWHNFAVGSDLSICRLERPDPKPFYDFGGYVALLERTVASVFENAAHPARIRPLRPVAMISQGYDSPACAALAAGAGCSEALTLVGDPAGPDHLTDSGSEIAGHLGLQTTQYRRSPDIPIAPMADAEFFATLSNGLGRPLNLAETQLAGTILCVGRPGEDVWGLDERYNLPDLISLSSVTSGSSTDAEFMLRVGCLDFGIPSIGAIHRATLQRISQSAEMLPWSLPGAYNRPIARRIAETAGIPRGAFGQYKMATASQRFDGRSEVSEADFAEYFQELRVPPWVRHRYRPWHLYAEFPIDLLYMLGTFWPGRRKRLYKWLVPLSLRSPRLLNISPAKFREGYRFHWGVERILHRYDF